METPFGKAVPLGNLDLLSGYRKSVNMVTELFSAIDKDRPYNHTYDTAPIFLYLLTLKHYGFFEEVSEEASLETLLGSEEINDLPYAMVRCRLGQKVAKIG
jgi:hypothetical protein